MPAHETADYTASQRFDQEADGWQLLRGHGVASSMEHAVYICKWSHDAAGWKLWVRSRPELRGSGAEYAAAESNLIGCIQDAGGAMQAVLEFDPPLPPGQWEAQFSQPELYLICGDERFEDREQARQASASSLDVMCAQADEFYVVPVCRACRHARGTRSDKPLWVGTMAGRFDGWFGGAHMQMLTSHLVFSEAFLALLTTHERQRLEFRQVTRGPQARKAFYELLGPAGPPLVGVAGLPISGWVCEVCDYRTFGYWAPRLAIHEFVAASDLPNPLPTMFVIGTPPELQLCVTAARWRELVGRKGTRGFTSRPLGVVSADRVIRDPELESLQAQQARTNQTRLSRRR